MFARIINLEHRTDRWQNMHPYLDTGLGVQRFNAVSVSKERALEVLGDAAKKTFMDAWPRTSTEKIKGLGAVGCYLSHLVLWKEFLSSENEVALILEDDLDPSQAKDLARNVSWLMARAEHWDIGLLGWVGTLYDPYKGFTGTHAYMLNRSGASDLVEASLPLTKQVDFYINDQIRSKKLRLVTVPSDFRMRQAGLSSDVFTTTWLHWAYLAMAMFSVTFVTLKWFERKRS
jgi:glycosyl transferase family 25